MVNPFSIKRVAWKITCLGYKRTFRIATADGKQYTTTRQDRLRSSYQWGGSYAIEICTIESADMMSVGIESGIQVDQGDATKPVYVQPIVVEQIAAEQITLSKELEAFYMFRKPKKPTEYIPEGMKCEEIHD